MATEQEFVTYKEFVESLPARTSAASGDKTVVSNSTDGPGSETNAKQAQKVLAGNVAPAFDSAKPAGPSGYAYDVHEKVCYFGELYEFTSPHNGDWNSSHVEKIDIDVLLREVSEPSYDYGYYYPLASTNVGNKTANPAYKCARISVMKGQKFVIQAAGVTTARLWATCDSDGTILRRADANTDTIASPIVLTIEEGEEELVFNSAISSSSTFARNMRTENFIVNLQCVIDVLKKNVSELSDVSDLAESTRDIVDDISEVEHITEPSAVTKTFTKTKTSSLLYPTFSADNKRASSGILEVFPGTDFSFDCGANYQYVVFTSSSDSDDVDWTDSGWVSSGTVIHLVNKYAVIMCKTSASHPSGADAQMSDSDISTLSESDINMDVLVETQYHPSGFKDSERTEAVAASANNPFRFRKKFYYHMMTSGDAVDIPAQSLFDVGVASRLGFDVFEANSLKVSDGFVMHHGQTATTFADNTVLDSNNQYANNVNVSGKTIAQIKSGYKYKAKLPQHQTKITELVEGLLHIKRMGMIPFFSFNSSYASSLRSVVQSVFGNDYVAYQGDSELDKTMIMQWSSLDSKSSIVAACRAAAKPYLHMPTTAVISGWLNDICSDFASETVSDAKTYFNSLSEENQLLLIDAQISFFKDLADAVHGEGCLIGWAANYCDDEISQLLDWCGWDCAASGHQVNLFDSGNLLNVDADVDFDGFTHTDCTETNGVLQVPATKMVYPSASISSCFLGKVQVCIRYRGTLKFKISGGVEVLLVSDGTREIVVSSATYNTTPTVWITAITDSDIYSLNFKASKC